MHKKKFLNFRPFFFTAISIALGIGTGYAFYFNKLLLGILLLAVFVLFACAVTFLTGAEIKRKAVFAIAFTFLFVFGAGSFRLQLNSYDSANLEGHEYQVVGKITRAYSTDFGQNLTLENLSIKGNRQGKLKFNASISVYGESNFDIGETVSFTTSFQDLGSLYEDRLSASNVERGIKYTAVLNSNQITLVGDDTNWFEAVHKFFRDSINSGMGEQESTVAYGLLLGNTAEIEYDVITSYRSAGVAHVFAVSGLHIGFLATALNFVLNKLRVNRLLKAILVTLILLFYSGVCGFSASSLRATVMSAVLLFSSIKGNRYDGLSSIGLACSMILACSPIQLFCVGFQLSFGVVLGIMFLSLPISRILSFMPRRLANSLATVVSAQLVGIPICLYAFGEFSTIAIIANLIFIPIVGVVFVLLFITALFGGLFSISSISLFIPNYIFTAINALISAIDYDVFIVGGFTFGIFVLFYYLALFFPCGLLNLKKVTSLLASLICLLVCTVGTTIINVSENSIPKAYVIGSDKACVTVIKNCEETIMVVSDLDRAFSLSRFNRLSQREGITDIDTVIFLQKSADIQLAITRLNQVFDFEKVIYYGWKNQILESVLIKSFGVTARSYQDGQKLEIATECAYSLNGYAVECSVNGNGIAVFAEFGKDYVDYKGLNGKNDYVIAVDYLEFINSEYKPIKLIGYRDNIKFANASSSGTVKLSLK